MPVLGWTLELQAAFACTHPDPRAVQLSAETQMPVRSGCAVCFNPAAIQAREYRFSGWPEKSLERINESDFKLGAGQPCSGRAQGRDGMGEGREDGGGPCPIFPWQSSSLQPGDGSASIHTAGSGHKAGHLQGQFQKGLCLGLSHLTQFH